jgi:hypothetical protein
MPFIDTEYDYWLLEGYGGSAPHGACSEHDLFIDGINPRGKVYEGWTERFILSPVEKTSNGLRLGNQASGVFLMYAFQNTASVLADPVKGSISIVHDTAEFGKYVKDVAGLAFLNTLNYAMNIPLSDNSTPAMIGNPKAGGLNGGLAAQAGTLQISPGNNTGTLSIGRGGTSGNQSISSRTPGAAALANFATAISVKPNAGPTGNTGSNSGGLQPPSPTGGVGTVAWLPQPQSQSPPPSSNRSGGFWSSLWSGITTFFRR